MPEDAQTPTSNPMFVRRRLMLGMAGAAALGGVAGAAQSQAAVMRVGPSESVRSLSSAAAQARPGMVIEVMAGDYVSDVAVWRQDALSLKAVGGRVRMIANGAHAQGKGIFVTAGRGISIEGFDFIGAKVPDTNGAGIRLETGTLKVKDCSFSRCETGLLTSNFPDVELEVENCEFFECQRPPGKPAHLLYAGSIGKLTVQGSYFHHARTGHLLKSRAAVNHVLYNRLTDEVGGRASYELEFPNGGVAVVIGNIIQQSSQTENPHLIAFGAEGYTHKRNELWMAHNTLVDNLPRGGIYLRVGPGAAQVRAYNNLLVGGGRFTTDASWDIRNNLEADWDAFVQAARENYALKASSRLRGRVIDAGRGPEGFSLKPTHQYQHPRGLLALNGAALQPGAVQLP